MALDTLNNDVYVNGNLSAKTMSIPAAAVGDSQVAGASSGSGIDASKLNHQYQPAAGDLYATTPTTGRRFLYRAKGAGTIQDFVCGVRQAVVGDSTHTVQLKKNGTNILSASTVIDNANTAYVGESAAGFTSTAYVAGDVFESDETHTVGTGTLGKGFFAQLIVREGA